MTIYYTMMRDAKTKKLISSEYSTQTSNIKIENSVLKELRDTEIDKELCKIQSRINSKYIFVLYTYKKILYSIIVDEYEEDKNVLGYILTLNKEYESHKNMVQYEFDTVIKETSGHFNKDKTLKVVDETKNVIADSLNLIIQRRENIDNLSKLANKLSIETQQMHKNIKKMKFGGSMYFYGYYGLIFSILIILLYFIIH